MPEVNPKPEDAPPVFKAFLAARGMHLESMVPRDAIDAMLDFFRTQRFEFNGMDWLLFQYGTYDWGEGRYFELDITRQLAVDQDWDDDADEDDDAYDGEGMWQLSLTCFFAPAPALDDLKSDNRWCESDSPEAVAEFETFIRTSAPYLALADAKPARVDLDFEDAG
jgi:hypothetical protein